MLTSHLYSIAFRLVTKFILIVFTTAGVGLPLSFLFSGLEAQPVVAAKIPQSNQSYYYQTSFRQQITTITAATTITSPFFIYLPLVVRPDPGIVNGDFELGRLNSPLDIGNQPNLGPASNNPPLNWSRYSLIGYELFFTPSSEPLGLPISAQSGSWATWLGGDNYEISHIVQQVNVPTSGPFLILSYWVQSYDSFCGSRLYSTSALIEDFIFFTPVGGLPIDLGGVIVDDHSGFVGVLVLDLCTGTQTNGWRTLIVNLGQYAGENVDLYIRSKGDIVFTSSFFIDNVSLGGSSLIQGSSVETLSLVPYPVPLSGSGNQGSFFNTDQSLAKSLLNIPSEVESITKKGNTLAPNPSEK